MIWQQGWAGRLGLSVTEPPDGCGAAGLADTAPTALKENPAHCWGSLVPSLSSGLLRRASRTIVTAHEEVGEHKGKLRRFHESRRGW